MTLLTICWAHALQDSAGAAAGQEREDTDINKYALPYPPVEAKNPRRGVVVPHMLADVGSPCPVYVPMAVGTADCPVTAAIVVVPPFRPVLKVYVIECHMFGLVWNQKRVHGSRVRGFHLVSDAAAAAPLSYRSPRPRAGLV